MRVLLVSTEYPPMPGGVGRYTANLAAALRGLGIDVQVACNDAGDGQYHGISPKNTKNSEVLMQIVEEARPDVVHVQFEPGLYGLILDPKDPRKSGTYIDSFYRTCRVPIVTTFHTAYTFEQWISQATIVKRTGKTGALGIPARAAVRTWKYFLNYKAFNELNRKKLRLSAAGICFSKYLTKRIGGGQVIYHGAEPATVMPKAEARAYFSLPQEKRIALVVGFLTVTKGWDILQAMDVPEGWIVVMNSSKSHYNVENLDTQFGRHVVDLQRGHLSEKELSILFCAADAVLLPYKVTAASGVMFDALAHGLPFVATDLDFFVEFATAGLGVATKRTPRDFAEGIRALGRDYGRYHKAVESFRPELTWKAVAEQHASIYHAAAQMSTAVKDGA